MSSRQLPIVLATRRDGFLVITVCPFCQGQHFHGGEGVRVAPCSPAGGFAADARGYVVRDSSRRAVATESATR